MVEGLTGTEPFSGVPDRKLDLRAVLDLRPVAGVPARGVPPEVRIEVGV